MLLSNKEYWSLIKESNGFIYVISCYGVIHDISCCYCTQCCIFSSWISHFVVRLFLVISLSCFNKIQQCIRHFFNLQATCIMPCMFVVRSIIFHLLTFFAISWFYFSVSVYNLLHFYQSSSHFFYRYRIFVFYRGMVLTTCCTVFYNCVKGKSPG